MLPGVPSTVFRENPRFEALYENIVSSKLNVDGTSKQSATNNTKSKVVDELEAFRTEINKRQLVINGLQQVAQQAENIPPELLQVVELVAATLDGRLADADPELLEDDIEYFEDNVDVVALTVSENLSNMLHQLMRMINASEARDSKSLAHMIKQRQRTLPQAYQDILDSRQRILSLACYILDAHITCLDHGIRILEQTIHGSVARGTRAQAEYLSTVAEGIRGKSQIAAQQIQTNLYTPELRHALQNYASQLESNIARLKRRESAAEDELAAYEEAGDGMREIGRRFAEVKAEVEKVQAELRRLDGSARS
ncbi:MAG: hypothetical protein M1821_003680 [Bathelium mastoideum]|nr:MAG: hypothetical protein M1821_003680 [Bathelium mastoideum]KAI9690761.1 MAG: hypothetical protein M1822_008380 [Bathelium mastoideum]